MLEILLAAAPAAADPAPAAAAEVPNFVNLVRARRLRVGFRRSADDHGVEGPPLWAKVPLRGLAPALAWCRSTMTSPRALLHPERAGTKESKP